MRSDYASAEFAVGPAAADRPKTDTGWTTAWSEPAGLPTLAPGGVATAPVMIERSGSSKTVARPVGKASDPVVAVVFVPATITVSARSGDRALVEARITAPPTLTKPVHIDIWTEDA